MYNSPYLGIIFLSLFYWMYTPHPHWDLYKFCSLSVSCAWIQFLVPKFGLEAEPINNSLVHPRIWGISCQAIHPNKSLLYPAYTLNTNPFSPTLIKVSLVSALKWGLRQDTCPPISSLYVLLPKLFCDCFHVILQVLWKLFPPAQIVHVWVFTASEWVWHGRVVSSLYGRLADDRPLHDAEVPQGLE